MTRATWRERKRSVRIGREAANTTAAGEGAPPSVPWVSAVRETRESSAVASGVEGNARLTGSVAAVLLVLLAVEGVTIVEVGTLLRVHVFVGMLLVPPVLLKSASTSYRLFRYYTGSAPYVRRGPPPLLLRLLGPAVVVLTFRCSPRGSSRYGRPARAALSH